jgi:hypothetical protein
MSCIYCGNKSFTFNLACDGCKLRMYLGESCKYLRKVYVGIYGEVEGWKAEPSCGCQRACIRKSRIVPKQETPSVDERNPVRKLRGR